MHIGVLVFLRMFSLPILLVAGVMFFQNSNAARQGLIQDALLPSLSQIERQFETLGAGASSVLPIAEAKFSSGRQMLGQTINLSGGGFVRP
jgi:hypothetical protein